jgi:hypothetical protein
MNVSMLMGLTDALKPMELIDALMPMELTDGYLPRLQPRLTHGLTPKPRSKDVSMHWLLSLLKDASRE